MGKRILVCNKCYVTTDETDEQVDSSTDEPPCIECPRGRLKFFEESDDVGIRDWRYDVGTE